MAGELDGCSGVKISIIMPVYNPEKFFLTQAIDSCISQTYRDWELCICDDGSTKEYVREVLDEKGKDPRINVAYLGENRGISEASNRALSLASGEFVAFLDHDDVLENTALKDIADCLEEDPEIDLCYSDEDKMVDGFKTLAPHYKPAWSPELLLSNNYICHLLCIRKKIVDEVGGFSSEFDGAQDYDLVLKSVEKARKIRHIPKILYHWRMHAGSTALSTTNKGYACRAGRKAIESALRRRGEEGEVLETRIPCRYRVRHEIIGEPLVSIIIPYRDKYMVTKKCLDSILEKTSYRNYEILLVDNNSSDGRLHEDVKKLYDTDKRIEIIKCDEPFNYSMMNNMAVEKTGGSHLLFLNNDTEVITPDWIESMLEHSQKKGVGVVGCLLLFPDDTIQHCRVVVGLGGIAGHPYRREKLSALPEICLNIVNCGAVTGASMMVRRSVFEELGGFDPEFAESWNDIDLCIRARNAGYRIVFTPYARLYHHESLSRGRPLDDMGKIRRFQRECKHMDRKHKENLSDPYFNLNTYTYYSGSKITKIRGYLSDLVKQRLNWMTDLHEKSPGALTKGLRVMGLFLKFSYCMIMIPQMAVSRPCVIKYSIEKMREKNIYRGIQAIYDCI